MTFTVKYLGDEVCKFPWTSVEHIQGFVTAMRLAVMGVGGLQFKVGCKLSAQKIKGIWRAVWKIARISCSTFRKVARMKRISAQLKGASVFLNVSDFEPY